MDNSVTIKDVRSFWEKNPLFQGESNFPPGTREYFHEHRRVYIDDCFAGSLDPRLYPQAAHGLTLDLGCGPGFWTAEFLSSGKAKNIIAADLTWNALQITRKRLSFQKGEAGLIQGDAESLPFATGVFDHVNCQGVIHHTPGTDLCLAEIARVLKPSGRALISVYYVNVLLRGWKQLQWVGRLLAKAGAKMPGRGREGIFSQKNVEEIVRLYDGVENPLGKAYSKDDCINMLKPFFHLEEIFFHFFPARALPFPIPPVVHKWLDNNMPFMIFAALRKKS